jgi:hypothetical protein
MSTDNEGVAPDDVELHDLKVGPSPHADGPSRPRGRSLLRMGMALLTLALIAALIFSMHVLGPAQPAPSPAATPVAPFLPLAGLSCVSTAAWAPTSDLVALIGPPDSGCGLGGYSPNVLNIYRARTAMLVRQLHPDPAIFAALGLKQPAPVTPSPGGGLGSVLSYFSLLWSPDGRRLAAGFILFTFGADPNSQQAISGEALLDADGSHELVLVSPQINPRPAYTVWDTQTAKTVAGAPGTASPDAPYATILNAQSYQWRAGGQLEPGAPFVAGTSTPSPAEGLVGNPADASSFGPWQPGEIVVLAAPPSGQEPPSYLYLYSTTFAAWSPDGRYLADGLSIRGLLRPTGLPLPSRAVLSALTYDLKNVVALPIRDAGLSEALAHDMPRPTSASGQPAMSAPPCRLPGDRMARCWRSSTNTTGSSCGRRIRAGSLRR